MRSLRSLPFGVARRFSATPAATPVGTAATERMNLFQSINNALDIALRTDESAIVFGEDVAFGGVFRCTTGLAETHGSERVFNTPLCEQGIVGFGVGYASVEGNTAIAEIQFADYIFPAFDQLVNEAAKFRFRSGGEFDVGGLTVRAPYGAVGHGAHYHSQSVEAFFAHAAGLKIVVPSNPVDAKGLLLAAIRDPNPVLFFEPKVLYRASVADVPVEDYEVEIGKASILRKGVDVTLVGWGTQVLKLEKAAETLSTKHRVECEVIDLRTIVPWDVECVERSVNRTGRLVVSHEAQRTGGFAGEIAAEIQARCFLKLEAPVARACGLDAPFPLAYEELYLPNHDRIVSTVLDTVNY